MSTVAGLRLRIGLICLHTSPLSQPGQGDAGGMNVVVLAQATALAELGHEVEIFTRRSDPATPAMIEVPTNGSPLRVNFLTAGPAAELAKSEIDQYIEEFSAQLRPFLVARRQAGNNFHVLHSHHWMSGIAALELATEFGIPHVQSFHSIAALGPRPDGSLDLSLGEPAESAARVPGEARCAQESDLIIAISQAEASTAIKRCGANPRRVRVVLPGVDHQVFYPCSESAAEMRQVFDGPYLLVAARLQPLKGVDLAISALAQISPEVRPKLLVAGAPSEDFADYQQLLTDLVSEHDLTEHVRFLGPVTRAELAELLHGADLTLVPSYSETYGLIALEAQACCCPVIASAAGGLQEAVRDGVTGILLGSRDPAQWGAAIESLLRDPATLAQMGSEACRHAAARSWENSAEELAGHYTALLDPATWLPGQGQGPVVLLHAHPDDESIHSGTLVRHLITAGYRVDVVTATRGERGDVVPGPLSHLAGTPELEVHRFGELQGALAVLGVDQHCFLGESPARQPGLESRRYRDSGMRWIAPRVAGPAEDLTDDALCAAELEEAANDLVAYLSAVDAQLLISYDANGTYGHPDHVRCHEIAARAAELSGKPMLQLVSPAENLLAAASYTDRQLISDQLSVIDLRLAGHELTMRRALAQYASQLTVDGDQVIHSGGDTEPLRFDVKLQPLEATP